MANVENAMDNYDDEPFDAPGATISPRGGTENEQGGDSVFGLTECASAPHEASPGEQTSELTNGPAPKRGVSKSSPTTKLKKGPAVPASKEEEVILAEAVRAEEAARERLQKLKAQAQRHIVSAAARGAVAARRMQKRQQGAELRREIDQRVGRDITEWCHDVPKASQEEVKHMSELFNKQCDRCP